jgi:hypothetical protein
MLVRNRQQTNETKSAHGRTEIALKTRSSVTAKQRSRMFRTDGSAKVVATPLMTEAVALAAGVRANLAASDRDPRDLAVKPKESGDRVRGACK